MTARQQEVLSLLDAVASSGSPERVEHAVNEFYSTDFTPEFILMLIRLLPLDWHTQHEHIVGILQACRDPRAIDILVKMAVKKLPYREYDELGALARKCTWALADIGTGEARLALEKLASQKSDPLLAGFAQKRLDRWTAELSRKAFSSEKEPAEVTQAIPPQSLVSIFMGGKKISMMEIVGIVLPIALFYLNLTGDEGSIWPGSVTWVLFLGVFTFIGFVIYRKIMRKFTKPE